MRLELDELLGRLYNAYEFLRDNDIESSTSRMLREAVDQSKKTSTNGAAYKPLVERLNGEAQELANACYGNENHSDGKLILPRSVLKDVRADPSANPNVLLEANQVWYWSALIAVAKGIPFSELNIANYIKPDQRSIETDPFQYAFDIARLSANPDNPKYFQAALTFVTSALKRERIPTGAFALMELKDMQTRGYFSKIKGMIYKPESTEIVSKGPIQAHR